MNTTDKDFEVLPTDEMRKKYGLFSHHRPVIKLNEQNVPERLRPLIAYAEIWGIADDLIREDFIRHSPPEALKRLAKIVAPFDDVLDEWLGGPEADNPNPTAEYIAFSAMRMVTDSL